MADRDLHQRVHAVRRFNRFSARRIGVLQEGYLESPFGLAEVRVLDGLAHRGEATAAELAREPDLNAGYLSRILGGFRWRGFVAKEPSRVRGRRLLHPTPAGRDAFASLQERSRAEICTLLIDIPASDQDRIMAAMGTIERLLEPPSAPPVPCLLRLAGAKSEASMTSRRGGNTNGVEATWRAWSSPSRAGVAGRVG